MRQRVADAYDGLSWKEKVERMPDYQVVAIYYKFLKDGKFDEKKPRRSDVGSQVKSVWAVEEPSLPVEEPSQQLTFDDIFA